MKKSVFILAMLLMAATAFSQTSRRTANSQKPASKEQTKSTEARSQRTSKKSSFIRKNNNSQNQPASRQSNKSTNASKKSDTPQATRRTSSGNTTVRKASTENTNGRRTSAGVSTERNTQAQSTVRRTHVDVTSNRSRNNAATNHNTRSTQTTRHHSKGHGSSHVNTGTKYVTYYKSPRLYHGTRVVRYHYNRAPRSRLYRARHYPYRVPLHLDIYWTNAMRRDYVRIYPMVSTWRYPIGYRIQTISAYDALRFHGEVMNVYGKVHEVFYSRETDEYMLYFGAYYPYHDLSVVVPGRIARRMSRWPAEYFERQHVIVTGLITSFEDKPEIVVRNTGQLRLY